VESVSVEDQAGRRLNTRVHPSGYATGIPDDNHWPPGERVQSIREHLTLALRIDLTESLR
jgi:hypothetical protein